MNNKIKSVVFDLDGVLVDSRIAMEYSWNKVKEKYALTATFDEYLKHIGIPFNEILHSLGISTDIDLIKSDYFKHTLENNSFITSYEFSREIFFILRENSITSGIITSKERGNTLALCSRFGFMPDHIITPDDVTRGKPYPESGIDFLRKTNLDANTVVYVGDMESDLFFANNVGFNFTLAEYGYGSSKIINNGYSGDSIRRLRNILEYI